MRKWILVLATALVATPALADKRVDDAVAKAESMADKGRQEEAVKVVQKAADQSNSSEGYVALARFQQRYGTLDDAQTAATKAVELSKAAAPEAQAEALATLSALDLTRGTGADALQHADAAVKAAPNSATALAAHAAT